MQGMDNVDGRVAVPVEAVPLSMVDKIISSRYLLAVDREVIYDLYSQGVSMGKIAARIGKCVSTVSREFACGRDEFGVYLLHHAHRRSVVKRLRSKRRKTETNPQLTEVIWAWLRCKVSARIDRRTFA